MYGCHHRSEKWRTVSYCLAVYASTSGFIKTIQLLWLSVIWIMVGSSLGFLFYKGCMLVYKLIPTKIITK